MCTNMGLLTGGQLTIQSVQDALRLTEHRKFNVVSQNRQLYLRILCKFTVFGFNYKLCLYGF